VKWVAFTGYACVNTACGGIQLTYASAQAASSRDASQVHLTADMALCQTHKEKPYRGGS
jgi:hypothetical protein